MNQLVDHAFLDDPYPAYHGLRAGAAPVWSTQFCGGAWLVSAYQEVATVLRDPRFTVRRAGGWANSSGPDAQRELRDFKRIFARSLLFVDGPQHTRLRRAMHDWFTPAALQSLVPVIDALAEQLLAPILDKVARGQSFDFMQDFARPLPALVIAHMLGVDAGRRTEFVAWSDHIAAFIGSPAPTIEVARAAQISLVAMNAYFATLVAERRIAPGTDMVSQLIAAQGTGAIGTTKELLAQCCTILFGGHETTRNLLGNGVLALLQHRPQWDYLVATPQALPQALRELLRFDSPVQYTGRRVTADLVLGGQPMARGDLVIALIGAANRDPAKFTDPERLDVTRNQGAHLAFGFGPHVCIGASLTYLESERALRALMRALPDLELAVDAPCWGRNAVYRGLEQLQLRQPATAAPVLDRSHA